MCLSVCLSAVVRPRYCTDPDVTWQHGRGCPIVVHYWADLQSGHGLRCYGNITRTVVTSWCPSRDMTTWCERPAGRGLRALLAADWRVTGRSQNCASYMGSGRGWLAGNWPSTAVLIDRVFDYRWLEKTQPVVKKFRSCLKCTPKILQLQLD